jgi:hypothetical protein
MNNLLASNRAEQPSPAENLAILGLAFRPFFLLGALFSVVSLGLWAGMLTGSFEHAVYGGSLWWHTHEMLFGFVSAIVVGFLLTAVQNWTGIPGVKGRYLLGLVLLWLSARIMLYFAALFPHWLIVLVDLLFLPAAAVTLASFIGGCLPFKSHSHLDHWCHGDDDPRYDFKGFPGTYRKKHCCRQGDDPGIRCSLRGLHRAGFRRLLD